VARRQLRETYFAGETGGVYTEKNWGGCRIVGIENNDAVTLVECNLDSFRQSPLFFGRQCHAINYNFDIMLNALANIGRLVQRDNLSVYLKTRIALFL
jgi:hypothetical protein